ncbi:MAG: M20 metallopeptidase family protein [Lachnospiraceae bacterium]|jgi:amidohydrolase
MFDIKKEAEALSPSIISWRRELHQIPECGYQLPKTAAYVCAQLDAMGIPYETYPDHSGITAMIGNKEGKVIAIRADMDALPIQEATELSYASTHPGKMHACGHDCHVAIALGTAKLLKKHEDELPGKVKLIFQPAEEVPPGGAILMKQQGVLENPHVDAVLGIHVIEKNNPAPGSFLIRSGGYMAGDDIIHLTIYGKGGHAAHPCKCVDPIVVSSALIMNLQTLISRNTEPAKSAVVSITDIRGETGTDNILPHEVKMIGTIRNDDKKTREMLLQRFREIVDGTTKAYGATYDLQLVPDYPVLENDPSLTQLAVKSIEKLYGKDSVIYENFCYMGGDDFAFLLEDIPGCYFLLDTSQPAKDGSIYPPHSPQFLADDSVLYKGTAAFAQIVLDYLSENV